MDGKVRIEITYCVISQQLGTAAWLASEFFRNFGPDAAVTILPGGQGVMEVSVDGERIYDKQGEGDQFPDAARVRRMVGYIRGKIDESDPAAADDTPAPPGIDWPMQEAEDALNRVLNGESAVKLSPQNYHIRRRQHLLGQQYSVSSTSQGREPERAVLFYRE